MNTGKVLRTGRIVAKDGKHLVIALDHGMIGMTKGIEDIEETVRKVTQGGADALLVNPGIAKKVASYASGKIGIVMTIPFDPSFVKLAVKLGVDAVKTTYFGSVPLSEDKYNQFSAIGLAAEEWGIPYMAEVVPVDAQGKTIYEIEEIKKAARIGAELGGDMVKTAYAGTPMEYRKVVKACPVPITVMGGPKMESIADLLKMVKDSIDAGAIGGTIGRNIWQYKDPEKMTRAIVKVIHENESVEEALKILRE